MSERRWMRAVRLVPMMLSLFGASASVAQGALPCASPAGSIDFGVMPLQAISGDTNDGVNAVSAYACSGAVLDGPELVYELILAEPGHVVAVQNGGVAGLSFLVLADCDEATCSGIGCGSALSAGTHYLVVDGAAGAAGAFDVSVLFEPTLNRWDLCETPYAGGPTLPTDTVSDFWSFDDFAYCFSDPASHNYPDGCTFAMYALVQCGTSMHIPLFDVESCHMRIFDVLKGRHVELSAVSTGGFSMSGYEIQWQDCSGMDARWNEQVTDISFADPTGLCGIFRIEFDDHAGFVWELLSNCSGAREPHFDIHDSLCSAFGAYAPLPSLSLVSATVAEDCPEIEITYTVLNDGCSVAHDVPVRLLDAGVEVATDVLPDAAYGETTTRTFTAVLSHAPTALVLVVDPDDVVLECNESGGVACDALAGLEQLPLAACSPAGCAILPAAAGPPRRICAGSPIAIDASASDGLNCAGDALEYQLRDLGGIVTPWGPAAAFAGRVASQTTDCFIDVRCLTQPACANSVRVRVEVERAPALDPFSTGSARLPCDVGIRLYWAPARFYGAAGGFYNVYRSEVSCSDALTRPPIASGLPAPTFVDAGSVEGRTYHYVVEAEDGTPAESCADRGPVVGGASTRVDVLGGAGIIDATTSRPELLPRVGGSLRLGGLDAGGRHYGNGFVDLAWVPDRALDIVAGEHFHVLRSEDPAAAGRPITAEAPPLSSPSFRDESADDTVGDVGLHAWYYRIVVADACDNDNGALDTP